MPVLVKYHDNSIEHIPKTLFNELLYLGSIVAFKRSSGDWVDIKTGPLRGFGAPKPYTGPERRSKW